MRTIFGSEVRQKVTVACATVQVSNSPEKKTKMAPAVQKSKKKSGSDRASTSAAGAPDDEEAQVPSPRRPAAASADSASSNHSVGISEIKKTLQQLKKDVQTLLTDQKDSKEHFRNWKRDCKTNVRDTRDELDNIVRRLDKVESQGAQYLFLHCFIPTVVL